MERVKIDYDLLVKLYGYFGTLMDISEEEQNILERLEEKVLSVCRRTEYTKRLGKTLETKNGDVTSPS